METEKANFEPNNTLQPPSSRNEESSKNELKLEKSKENLVYEITWKPSKKVNEDSSSKPRRRSKSQTTRRKVVDFQALRKSSSSSSISSSDDHFTQMVDEAVRKKVSRNISIKSKLREDLPTNETLTIDDSLPKKIETKNLEIPKPIKKSKKKIEEEPEDLILPKVEILVPTEPKKENPQPKLESKLANFLTPEVDAHLSIKINAPLKGTIEDHPMTHGKRFAFRGAFVVTVLMTLMYEATALPETYLSQNPFWWFVLWAVVLYMNAAYLLFLSNFWYRATMKCEQYPEDARRYSKSPFNRFKGSVSLAIMPIAGEPVEMIKKHFSALYDSHVNGLHRDILIIADDLRVPMMIEDKEIPCLSQLSPTQAFEEPYAFQPKLLDKKYLEMAEEVAKERKLTHKVDLSVTNADGTGYVLFKFCNADAPEKCFYYFARHKWDNVPSMLKGANLNQAMNLPEVKQELDNAPSGNSFVFIVDARHMVKVEFKAALLQYFWTWNSNNKEWMFHEKLASVQAQHWYPNIPNGHPLQPNNRFFFDGVMKGRLGAGSVPNAGTMNVFQYKSLIGIDPENPSNPSFCTYSVTEDKATEVEYFIKGYYTVFHPYPVSTGVPAGSIAKEFDRLLRWARGNFVVLFRRNTLKSGFGMKFLFRLWAIEGTLYPINGVVTLLFYFACLLYVGFGVTFLTFHGVTVLVMFLLLMLVGRIAYVLSVPTMTEEDKWATMQGWLNVMPVYVWAVCTYFKGYAKNAVWLSTGSKTTSDGMKIQWVVLGMQVLNIIMICLGIGFLFGKGYVDMWEFFARIGLGAMLVVMQHSMTMEILKQNGIIGKDAKLGPILKFTAAIVVGLLFCLMWQFQEAPY